MKCVGGWWCPGRFHWSILFIRQYVKSINWQMHVICDETITTQDSARYTVNNKCILHNIIKPGSSTVIVAPRTPWSILISPAFTWKHLVVLAPRLCCHEFEILVRCAASRREVVYCRNNLHWHLSERGNQNLFL